MAAMPAEVADAPGRAIEDRRFERKFVTTQMSRADVEAIVKRLPAMFRAAYPPRQINNIYFDTVGLGLYLDNIRGTAARYKARIRWYGADLKAASQPKLEFKNKTGMLGTKDVYALPDFDVDGDIRTIASETVWRMTDIPLRQRVELRNMRPTVANTYRRRYFVSADGAIRITVDTDVRYFHCGAAGRVFRRPWRDDALIVEMKYAARDEKAAAAVAQQLPFRVVRNSKYINAVEKVFT